jgi:malonyl-CoA O-methyltransferase
LHTIILFVPMPQAIPSAVVASPPSLDPVAAQRWANLPLSKIMGGAGSDGSAWLHEEVAQRMAQRLDVVRIVPKHWVHWLPCNGGLQAHQLLQARYPKASCSLVEQVPERLAHVQQLLGQVPAWRQWLQRSPVQKVLATPEPSQAQMLWANMCLHHAHDPMAWMKAWHQALDNDGFLMFSYLGPLTLQGLREVYRQAHWPEPTHALIDMHDVGDMLIAAGFVDPVMDTETIELTFSSSASLLKELRGLGRNFSVQRFQGLRTAHWKRQLEASLDTPDGLRLRFEIVYGHAVRAPQKLNISSETEFSLTQMREMLRHSKTKNHRL